MKRNMAHANHAKTPCPNVPSTSTILYQTPAARMLMSDIGSINFHAKAMSWSDRRRGSVPRIQIMTKISDNALIRNHRYDGMHSKIASKNRSSPAIHDSHEGMRFASHSNPGACQPPRNSVTAKPESAMAERYSARKKMANLKPLYSV